MQEYKQFKDPIYGYVKIPSDYVTNIIDSAEFQRLRRIVQTSYSPLYSAAVRTELSEFELKRFESDAEYRNQIAEQLAAQLAPVLIKYLYINIFDSFEPHNMEVTKYLQAYLKVKRYSAPRDRDILKKFMDWKH